MVLHDSRNASARRRAFPCTAAGSFACAAPIPVAYAERSGIINFNPTISPRRRKVSLASPPRERFPVSTIFFTPYGRAANIAQVATVSNTILSSPSALSSGVARSCSRPKFAAVMSLGMPGSTLSDAISDMRRSIFEISPPFASRSRCSTWSTSSTILPRPCSVPPPMPVPPRYTGDHGGTRPHADDERLIEPREPESALADAVEFGSEAAFEPVYVVRDER